MTRSQIQRIVEKVVLEEALQYVSSTDLLESRDVVDLSVSAAERIMKLWDKGFTYELGKCDRKLWLEIDTDR